MTDFQISIALNEQKVQTAHVFESLIPYVIAFGTKLTLELFTQF